MGLDTAAKRSLGAPRVVLILLAVISVVSSVYSQQTDQLDSKFSAPFSPISSLSSPSKFPLHQKSSRVVSLGVSYSVHMKRREVCWFEDEKPPLQSQEGYKHARCIALVGGCAGQS